MPNRAIIQSNKIQSLKKGSGAAIFPAQFTRIGVFFSKSNSDGHMGARKFVQQNLPRIAFHNPQLTFKVHRYDPRKNTKNENVPATLSIYKAGSEEPEQVDIKGLHSEEIVKRLLEKVGASEVSENALTA